MIHEFKVEVDSHKTQMWLSSIQRVFVPRALVSTLNYVAFKGRERVQNQMRSQFDRPTPWTIRSVRVDRAKEARLFAFVQLDRNEVGSIQPSKSLAHQIFSGYRNDKSSERALRATGFLGNNEKLAPGVGAKRDQYGNVRGSDIVKMLSSLKAFGEMGYNANATTNTRSTAKQNTFIALPAKGNRKKGVYLRTSTSLVPFMFAIKNPRYKKRLYFFEAVEKEANPLVIQYKFEKNLAWFVEHGKF